jgi:CheY-like chemotaxis protein
MSNTKGIPFSPPWQISKLEKPDQAEATELDARPVERWHAGADNYLIKRFDKNELLALIQVGYAFRRNR